MSHKEWYARGYLPHFDATGMIQAVTFRLADSLPARVVQSLGEDKEMMKDAEKWARFETYLNAGHGRCFLRDPRIARIVEGALHYFHDERYHLIAWVIMPNHVHVMIRQFEGYTLDNIIHSWKSYTATKANRILRRDGAFWYRDYYDRYIRDERHFVNAVRYIHENPVAAGLAAEAEEWQFSSARRWNGE